MVPAVFSTSLVIIFPLTLMASASVTLVPNSGILPFTLTCPSSINLSASFSDNTGCNTNETNAGTAPENCSVLSINDDSIFEISIFPNPADNIIMLNNITQAYNIVVYNLLGQKLISQKVDINTNTIDVANLAKGTYVLKFDTYNEVLMFIKK
mgnify:CR=1 FL=1